MLVLKYYYGDSFVISSDGFWVSKEEFERGELDGNWGIALENVRDEFGYRFTLVGEIYESSGHKYYKLVIFPEKEAVMCYLRGVNHSKAATNFKYSASMYISEKSEYQQNNKFIGKGITDRRLYCKRTDKFFIK